MVDEGFLTLDQLSAALAEQDRSGLPLGKVLVQLGFVSEATLRDALSEKLGLQSVDLAHIIVDPAQVARIHDPAQRSRQKRARLRAGPGLIAVGLSSRRADALQPLPWRRARRASAKT